MNLIPDNANIDEMRKQVLEASLKGVENFLNDYIKDNKALDYIYEGDVQADLYNSIRGSLKGRDLNYGEKQWVISEILRTSTKSPCLVHCEQLYRTSGKGRGKAIDIVVWDPADANAPKDYKDKDLLLLIEVKYRSRANKETVRMVKSDYQKLKDLKLKGHQRGLALTFTAAKIKENKKQEKLLKEGNPISACNILKEKRIQALIVCQDSIVEIPIQNSQ